MPQKQLSPAGYGEARVCRSGKSDAPEYSRHPLEIQEVLRLSRLARRFGLTGSRAVLIASLAFGTGVRI